MALNFLKKIFSFGNVSNISKRISLEDESRIISGWSKVEELLRSSSPSSLKQAVVLADKIFDQALKPLRRGETMGERLKQARELFAHYQVYDRVWQAHKVRNSLVHDIDFDPPYFICRDAVNNFKAGLEELGVHF